MTNGHNHFRVPEAPDRCGAPGSSGASVHIRIAPPPAASTASISTTSGCAAARDRVLRSAPGSATALPRGC
ncbi:hypothetical protein I552_9006, partial [Mycobacterium xenopi 3993]